MTLEELKKLIAGDEGETVEVKETTGQRRDACETLCAFLNKDGGTVRTVKTGTSEVISKGRTGMAEAPCWGARYWKSNGFVISLRSKCQKVSIW